MEDSKDMKNELSINSLWNKKNLSMPPVQGFNAAGLNIDSKTLLRVISEAIETFRNQNDLYKDAAILSRAIYRLKQKFRSDKGLKGMEKLNRALLQFLRVCFLDSLELFQSLIQIENDYTYLPSLNMLHYILVRLQGLSKLFVRVCESALYAAYFLHVRLSTGHLWKVAIMMFANVAKIFYLTRSLIIYVCQLYKKILPFTKQLQNPGSDWLPENYFFPNDLEAWLSITWLYKDDEVIFIDQYQLQIASLFNLIDLNDDDVEICDEYIDLDRERDDSIFEVIDLVNTTVEESEVEEISNSNVNQALQLPHVSRPSKRLPTKNPIQVVEDIGIAIETDQNRLATSPKKNRILIKNILNQRDPIGKDELIGAIRSKRDLMLFSKSYKKLSRKQPQLFKGLDRLQRDFLSNIVEKRLQLIRQTKNGREIQMHLAEVRYALKASLKK